MRVRHPRWASAASATKPFNIPSASLMVGLRGRVSKPEVPIEALEEMEKALTYKDQERL